MVWDRIFGTWEPESEPVRYGLTTNIGTNNVIKVALHEYVALWGDIRRARSWRARWGLAWHGPGWRPAEEPELEPSSAARG